ncbi:radical SAM protein [Streptomyces sp. NPDC003717]|uniref:radical SAM protein n=1 Tax=Streptomyces sp. NPDC003717 TaxID=3154276 RepID=UPI0033A67420
MSAVIPEAARPVRAPAGIRSVELEITGTCQLQCVHCCTDSGPKVGPGKMTRQNWHEVIIDVANLGIPAVQMIGGEPTLAPFLPHYIAQAVDLGLAVEVYSNLAHMRPAVWAALSRPGVTLATSYYSDQPGEHDKITASRGSHTRTRDNIIEAVRRGIPLRAGIVEVQEGQRIQQAEADLRALGVKRIKHDKARPVGRAADPAAGVPSVGALCGHCFRHRVSINPDGQVSGCILSRFIDAGNVRERRLTDILNSQRWEEITATIPLPRAGGCPPDDSSDCQPANTPACAPSFNVPAVAASGACPPDDSQDCTPANTDACLPSFPDDENAPRTLSLEVIPK